MEALYYPVSWHTMLDSTRSAKSSTVTLYCFSPAVMIATAVIESLCLVLLLVRKPKTELFRLVLWTLLALALFQYVEYYSCTIAINELFVRIGLATISFLPALGFHMVSLIAVGVRGVRLGYGIATALAIAFLLAPGIHHGSVCTGNYIVITVHEGLSHVFGGYYFLYLMWALFEGYKYINHPSPKTRSRAMAWLMAGYVSFMLPMAIVYSVDPSLIVGLPSIMCGFAIVLAAILTLKVAPLAHQIND